MTLAINITDEHGLSNETCRELLPRKSKVINAVLANHKIQLTSCTLLRRWSTCFSFKSWCALRVVKAYKRRLAIVLQ